MKNIVNVLKWASLLLALCVSGLALAAATKTQVIVGSAGGQGPGTVGFAEEIDISGLELINTDVHLGSLDENYGVSVQASLTCFGWSKAGGGSSNAIPCFNTGGQVYPHFYTDGNGVNRVRVAYQDFTNNPYMVSYRIEYQIQLVSIDHNAVVVYDDALTYGANNFFLTGDGQDRFTQVDFYAVEAKSGSSAIAIRTLQDGGYGSHWKLMLFANGSTPAFQGINLSGKKTLTFWAKASRPVQLMGAFGTGDDTAVRGYTPMVLTTEYQRITWDLVGLNLSDINTFMWVYLHKDMNPFSFTGVTVYLDDIVIN